MKRHQPALLGGLLIGVLSSLPVISAGNICCCLWVICGGLLTVYLQQQNKLEPVETGDAVVGGLIAGVVGAVLAVIADYVGFLIVGQVVDVAERMRSEMDKAGNVPPEVRDAILKFVGSGGIAMLALMKIPVYAVFGMLGSLLGLAFFRKKTPPATQG